MNEEVQGRIETTEIECARLRNERSDDRHDVWKESGYRGQAFHVHAKAERLFVKAMADGLETDDLDDAYDAINYLHFLIYLVFEECRDGSWPWPNADQLTLDDLPADEYSYVLPVVEGDDHRHLFVRFVVSKPEVALRMEQNGSKYLRCACGAERIMQGGVVTWARG